MLIGDYLLVNKFVHVLIGFAVEWWLLLVMDVWWGDVFVFKYLEELECDFIKWVIGLLGEIVELWWSCLFIDGEFVDEFYFDLMWLEG